MSNENKIFWESARKWFITLSIPILGALLAYQNLKIKTETLEVVAGKYVTTEKFSSYDKEMSVLRIKVDSFQESQATLIANLQNLIKTTDEIKRKLENIDSVLREKSAK